MRTRPLRLTVAAAQMSTVTVAAVLVSGPQPAALAAAAVTAVAPSAAASRQLVLINGDRLLAGPGVMIAARRSGGSLLSVQANGTAYEIPAIAVPYLGHGLAPSLFDVSALSRLETTGRLPVRVTYRGRRPVLPGVRYTWAGAGTAEGYLTGSSAKAFGAALARQYLADHARARYGTDGVFGGGVSIALAGPVSSARTSPFSAGTAAASAGRAGLRRHTLTVTGTNLAAKPDTGDMVFVWNVDNGRRSDIQEAFGAFDHGVTKFSVPAGHYWAVGIFGHPEVFGTAPARLTVLPQFTVAADTTVHVAEQAANSKVTMVTPRPAVAQSDNVYLVRALGSGPESVLQFSNVHSAMWLSPTGRRPTVGWLRADVSQELTSPPGLPGTPYGYALSFADPRGTIPPQRYLVQPARLTTVSESYYQDVRSPGYWTIFGTFPKTFNGYVEPYTYPGSLPGRRTLYLGGSASMDWASYYGALSPALDDGAAESFRAVRPGARIADDWNRYPLHPAVNTNLAPANRLVTLLPSADRSGNMLTLEVTPFGDNQPGHLSAGFSPAPGAKITGSYQIDENGKRIAAGNAAGPTARGPFYTRVRLSQEPSVIRFALNAARTGQEGALSPASQTVWAWRSAHETGVTLPPGWYCYNPVSGSLPRHCAVQPMMTLDYRVAGMALDGSTPPGRQVLTITAGHLQLAKAASITGASVQVSFDAGKTWRPAAVTALGGGRFQAAFTAPAGAYVTLRTTARDSSGASITETITRGYAITR